MKVTFMDVILEKSNGVKDVTSTIKKRPVFVKHTKTGALIPLNDNVVKDLQNGAIVELTVAESKSNRKYFTLSNLTNKWDYDFEHVMHLLSEQDIPVFSVSAPINSDGSIDAEKIFIFEEYVIAVEKKLQISHKKIKPKSLHVEQ